MKISVLIENSLCSSAHKDLKAEHGLCLHIAHNDKNILFDTGRSELFARNAEKMNINLAEVDYLVVSHAHADHGGGLKRFFEINQKAEVYMHRLASEKFYTKIGGLVPYYIGLDSDALNENKSRIHFIDGNTSVTESIQLLVNFPHQFPLPKSNLSLYMKDKSGFMHDTFRHETVMIIKEADKNVVFTACSHSGIVNMVEKAREYLHGEKMDAVFGGFHTFNPINRKNESNEYLDLLAANLQKYPTVFYTGHCTGKRNFDRLKEKLGARLQPMNTGAEITV